MEDNNLLRFSLLDFWLAIIAGELIALLTLPILLNLKILHFLLVNGVLPKSIFLPLWLIFLPLLVATSLYLAYRLTIGSMPTLFQIAKYGIVGILNTVLGISVFNVLIFFSDISRGLLINFFAVVAFIISVTNGFFWSKFWIFKKGSKVRIGNEYIKSFGVSGVLTLVNVLIIHTGVNVIETPPNFDTKLWANIIFLITIPISFLGNFFGYRKFVFKG